MPEGFVLVEGGAFTIGSPESENGRDSDETRHRVTVSDFYLGKHEVTVSDFREFVAATQYKTAAEKSGGSFVWTGSKWEKKEDASWRNPYFEQQESEPVVCVSWYDAVKYCNWLSRADGLDPAYGTSGTSITWDKNAEGYRLPTEAEWEYGARGGIRGRGIKYAGVDDTDDLAGFVNFADSNTHFDWSEGSQNDGHEFTASVGSLQPNELGLYDMSGNVIEWCWDRYGAYPSGSVTDPTGPSSGSNPECRGGSYLSGARARRVANRLGGSPGYIYFNLGFRIAARVRK